MKALCVLILSLLFVGGCASRVPLAVNPPLTAQYTARSAHHWDVLADDVAGQTELALGKHHDLWGRPIHVVALPKESAFDQAFRSFLVTRLVNRGLPVAPKDEKDGVEVTYRTQLVHHATSHYAHVPGTLTVLTAGVWVVRELVEGSFAAVPGTLGLAALADWGIGRYGGAPTNTELIVTTSVSVKNRFVFRKSDVYYIEPEDGDLYQAQGDERAAPGSGSRDGEPRVRRLEVVGP